MNKSDDKSESIGQKMFHPEDYQSNSELSQALSETHEQVSDVYSAGTIDGLEYRATGTRDTAARPVGPQDGNRLKPGYSAGSDPLTVDKPVKPR